MMRHPFHGLHIAETEPNGPLAGLETGRLSATLRSRRKFFSQVVGALAALFSLVFGRQVLAQAGAKPPESSGKGNRPGTVTTQAIGEEGAGAPPRRPGEFTTQALGEEGGPSRPPRYTTFALGEEGAGYPRPSPPPRGRYTTFALGEEGAGYPRPALPPRGRYTTYALGEEGSGYRDRPRRR